MKYITVMEDSNNYDIKFELNSDLIQLCKGLYLTVASTGEEVKIVSFTDNTLIINKSVKSANSNKLKRGELLIIKFF